MQGDAQTPNSIAHIRKGKDSSMVDGQPQNDTEKDKRPKKKVPTNTT